MLKKPVFEAKKTDLQCPNSNLSCWSSTLSNIENHINHALRQLQVEVGESIQDVQRCVHAYNNHLCYTFSNENNNKNSDEEQPKQSNVEHHLDLYYAEKAMTSIEEHISLPYMHNYRTYTILACRAANQDNFIMVA